MTMTEEAFVVKVCGITNEKDAKVATDAGANALGFNFYRKSPRYISPQRAREIVEAVPGSYLKVGVFVNASEEELLSVAGQVPLDVMQLHGDLCDIPTSRRFRVWQSIAGGSQVPGHNPITENPLIEAYLLDAVGADYGGSGNTFPWEMAAGFPYHAIVAGGLDASNVGKAIAAIRPWGVDACSRLETRPGEKDAERVRDFVRAALSASERLKAQEVASL